MRDTIVPIEAGENEKGGQCWRRDLPNFERCPACLAAEKKLKDLIEAGNSAQYRMNRCSAQMTVAEVAALDAVWEALAAIKEG